MPNHRSVSAVLLCLAFTTTLEAQTMITYSANDDDNHDYITSLDNPYTLTVGSGASATQSGVLSGTGPITKTGGGTLALSAANTYEGGTTVSAGTLYVAYDYNLGAASGFVTVTSGATLSTGPNFYTNRAITLDGSGTNYTNGNGQIAVGYNGTGSLALTDNAFADTYGLTLGYTGGTGTVDISSGATLNVNESVYLNTAPSTLNINTGGTLAAAGLFNNGGTLNLAGGTLRANASFSSTSNITLSNSSTVNSNGFSPTLSGILSGTGALTKSGTGTLTLSGANTYSGATTVSGGTLSIAADSALGTAPGSATTGHLTLDGGTLATTATFTLDSNRGIALGSSGGTVDTATSTALTYGGIIAGSGPLTKSGDGSLALSGANTYTGTTAVNAGSVVLSNTTTSPSFAIASGATLELNVDSGTRDGGTTTFTGTGTLAKTGSGTAVWGIAPATFALGSGALIDVQAGTLSGGSSANEVWTNNLSDLNVASGATFTGVESNVRVNSLTGAGTVTTGYNGEGYTALTVGVDDGSGTFSGVIANTDGTHIGSLVKTGSGTQILSGANTYTGTTTISGGTLQLGDGTTNGSIASTAVVNDGTIVFNRNDDYTFNGVVSGSGGLVQDGNVLRLASAQTYTGPTSVKTGGVLVLSTSTNQGLSASTTVDVETGAIFDISNRAQTIAGLSGAGTVYSFIDGSDPVRGSLTVDTAAGQTYEFSGTLGASSPEFSLTKSGDGTQTLSGANTYTGTTTVNAGTLNLGHATDTLADAGTVSIAGGTLALGTHSDTVGTVNLASGNITGSGTLTASTFNLTDSGTISANLAGAAALTKSGAGTVTVDGTINLSGSSGTAGAAGTDAVPTYNSESNLLDAGTATHGGSGGAGSAAGSVVVNAGTLTFNASNLGLAGGSGGNGGNGGGEGPEIGQAGNGGVGGSGGNGGAFTLNTGTVTLGSTSSLNLAGGQGGNGGDAGAFGASDGNGGNGGNGGSLTLAGGDLTLASGTISLSGGNGGAPGIYDGAASPGSGGAAGDFTLSGGSFTMNGGALNLTGGTTSDEINGTAGNGGDVTITGGTFNWNGGTIDLRSGSAEALAPDGTFSLSGGTLVSTTSQLDGANNLRGAFTFNSGTLRLTDTTVTFNDGSGAFQDAFAEEGMPAELGNRQLVIDHTFEIAADFAVNTSSTLTADSIHVASGTFKVSANNAVSTGTSLSLANTSGAAAEIEANQTFAALSGGGSSGGNIALTNAALTVGDGTSTTYAGSISGDGALTKAGSGTLTLSGSNSYSGTTTIADGTLQLGSNDALGGSAVNVSSGATLDLDNRSVTIDALDGAGAIVLGSGTLTTGDSDSHALSGTISGTGGSLTKQGSGALTLSGSNTYDGATTVAEGTLQLGSTDALGGSAVNVGSGATLDLNGNSVTIDALDGAGEIALGSDALTTGDADDHALSGTISGTGGSLTKQGSGTLTLSGSNTYDGTTTVSAGTLQLGSTDALGGSAVNVSSGATLDLNGNSVSIDALDGAGNLALGAAALSTGDADDHTLSGTISGTGATLTKAGTGTLTLSGTNTYTGATTINAGTLSIAADAALGSAPGSATPGHLTLDGGPLATTATFTLDANRGVALGSTGGTFNTASSTTFTVAGDISGTGALSKTGDGTLALTGANDYSGGTTVSAGTLSGNTASLQGNILNNAAVVFDQPSTGTYADIVSGTGTLTKTGNGTLTFTAAQSYTGGTTVEAGTLDLQTSNALATAAPVSVASGASIAFNSNSQTFGSLEGAGNIDLGSATLTTGDDNNNTTVSGVISGTSGSLVKNGSGTLTLTGVNTYTGPTTINTGTLAIAADSGLGAAPDSFNSNQLTLNGGTLLATAATVTLDANRGITLDSSGGTLASDSTLVINGQISGSGNLALGGEGFITLNAANTFTGETSIDSDLTVTLGHRDALQNSTVTKTGSIRFGSLTEANVGAISGAEEWHTLLLENATSQAVALSVGSNGATTTYAGVISGAGSLNLNGGQLTLSGANTFTGPTTLSSSGTLTLANESGLQNSTVTLNGGPLSYGSGVDAVTFGGLAGSYDLTLPSMSLTVGGNNANTSYSGSISGNGAFIKAGSGNLTFSGSFSDEAPVSLDGGTFTLANSSALERNIVTLNGGALSFGTLTSASLNGLNGSTNLALTNIDTIPAAVALTVGYNGGDSTYSGVLSGTDGSLTKDGSGTFTLSGANTFTGNTTVSSGTLALTSSGSLAGDVNLNSSSGTLSLANATGLQHSTVNLGGGALSYDAGVDAVTFGGVAGSGDLYLPSTSLTVGGNNANTSYTGTVYNSGTFIKTGDGNLTFGGSFNDAAPVSLDGGTFTLANSSALANSAVTLNGGALSFGTQTTATLGALSGSQNLALANSTLSAVALTVGNNSESGPVDSTYSGVLSGTNGSLTKDGSGTFTLSGANTFTGTTTVSNGTLALSSTGSLAGNVNLESSGTLSLGNATGLQDSTVNLNGGELTYGSGVNAVTFGGLSGSYDLTLPSTSLTVGGNGADTSYTGTVNDSGTFIKAGTGNLTFGGSFNNSAPVRLDAGTFTLGNSSALQYADVTLNGGALSFGNQPSATLGSLAGSGNLALTNATLGTVALTVGTNGSDTTYSGVLSGTDASLTKDGYGTFTLSGANTFTGTTTVSGGTLTLAHEDALANSVITASGGTLSFGALENVNLRAFNTSSEVVVSSTSANPFTLTIGGSGNDNSTWSDYLGGSGSINKVGSGTLTLSGYSSGYSGTTTLTGGTVKLEGSSVLENSTVHTVSGGGTLDFASNTTVELGGLEGDGNLTLANQSFSAVTLEVGKNDANTTFSGALSGTGSLDKKGAGTLTLSGANTFSGTTTISAGTLELAHSLALQDSVVTPGSGLSFGELESATFAGLDGSGSVVLTNTATPTAGVALTLDLAADMPTGQTYYGTVSGDGSLIKTGTGTQTLSGTLSHAGGTTVAAGTLTLSGTNTASGDTTVSGGSLQLASTNALQDSTLVTTSAGGTVSFSDQTAFTLGGLEGDGNIALTNGPSQVTLTVGNNDASTAYSGVLSQGVSGFDSANLIKVGNGTLTLGGANTFSGTTTISAGTIELAHTNALQNSIVSPGTGLSFGTLESATLGGLSGSGALALTNTTETPAGVALTLNVGNSDPMGPTYSGVISGDGSLTKTGSGTQTLSGANTFTGDTTVSAGTLKLENSNALQNSTLVTSSGGGTVDFSSLSTLNLGGLAGDGNISASFFALDLNVGANNQDTTYAGALSGSVNLTKSGTGTLTLSGANGYSNSSLPPMGTATTIAAGTIDYATRAAFYNGTTRANPAVADGATAAFHVGDSGYFTDSDIGDILGDGNFSSGATLEFNTADATAGTFTLATALANGNSGANTLNLAKSGTGNLVLSGSNTYTGTTTVKSGTLTLASDTALGATTGGTTVASGATLAFTNNIAVGTEAIANSGTVTNTSGTNSYAGVLSGTGNLSIAAGALTLSGENTFAGSTSVNGGTLSIAADSALGAAPGSATAGQLTLDGGTLATSTSFALAANRGIALGSSGGTVETADATTLTYGGVIDGSGDLTKTGTGSLTLSGANTFTGDTTVSGGTLILDHTNALAGSTVTTAAGVSFGTLTHVNLGGLSGSDNVTLANASSSAVALNVGANGANTTYSGVLSGPGTLTKSGSGTLTLTNSSDLSGVTTVSAGTLAIASGGTFTATGGLTIGDGAESVAAFGLHSGGTLEVSGANGITKQSSNAFLDANDGTFRVVGGTLNTNIPVTVADNASLVVDTNGFLTVLAGQISGNGGVVKTGAGQLTLAEINSYTGPTTITGGTLSAISDARLGTAPTEATAGHLTFDGGTLLSVGPAYTLDSNRGIALGAAGGTIQGNITYGGIIAGSGSLTKAGINSTLSLTGANTYTGATSVTGGTLSINADAALGAVPGSTTPGHLTLNGGTLATTTTFELAEQRGVALGASGGTINTAAGTTLSYDGIIAGAGTLTKSGDGTLTLGGTNTYSGATNLNAGTLSIAADAALGTAPASASYAHLGFNGGTLETTATMTLAANRNMYFDSNGGSLDVANATTLTFGGSIGGSGGLTKSGDGTLTLTGAQTYTGAITVNSGTLNLDSGYSTTMATSSIANEGTLNVAHTLDLTLAANLSGSGTITNASNSTLRLTGNNTNTGEIQVTQGTAEFGARQAFYNNQTLATAAAGLHVGDGATGSFHVGDSAYFSSSDIATIAANASFDDGATLGLNTTNATNGAFTLSAALTDTNAGANVLSLEKLGAGTLTLAGANTYTGTTTVSEGTLTFGTLNAFYSGDVSTTNAAKLTVLNGATAAFKVGVSGGFDTTDLATVADNATFGNGATLGLDTSDAVGGSFDFTHTGTYGIAKTGSGTLVLTGDNTGTGALIAAEGVLQIGDGGSASLAASAVTTDASLVFNHNNDFSYAGTIDGSGSLTKMGAGTLTLTNDLSHTGATTVSGGNLTVNNPLAFTTTVTVDGEGSTLTASSTVSDPFSLGAYTLFNTTAGATGLSVGDGGTVTGGQLGFLSDTSSTTALTVESGGSVIADTFLLIGSGSAETAIANVSGADSVLGTNEALLVGLVGVGEVNVSDSGAVFAGVTLIGGSGAGRLNINSGGTFETGAIRLADNELIGVSGASGELNLNAGGVLRITGETGVFGGDSIQQGTGTATINLAGGTLEVVTNDFTTTVPATLVGGTTTAVDVASGLTATIGGTLSGSGSLTKAGTGTFTLSGTNTYEGGTTVSAGTLAATDATQFGTGAVTVQSGGNVTLANPTAFNQSVTIDGSGASFAGDTVGGPLGITSSFTQFGSSGTATTLTVSNGGNLTGANLDFGANADQDFTASVASGGTITAGATVVIGRNATAASDVTVTGADSALTVGDFANSTFDDEIMVGYGNSSQATLTIADGGRASSTYTYIGENGGDGFLHIADGGTLTTRRVVLTQASDANNGGTLQVDSGGTLQVSKVDGYAYYGQIGNEGDQGLLRLNGGTLQVHDTSAIFVNAQTELTSGTTSVIDTAGVNNFVVFGTNVSGAGNLQVSGGGVVAVVGANTFSGRVQIEDGTFALDTAATIDASAGVDLGTAGILDLTLKSGGFTFGTDQTLSGSGTINLAENQSLTLAAGATFAPGNSAGMITISGNFTLDSASIINLEIGGLDRGIGYDAFDVSGTLTLGGTLNVTLIDGFTPTDGQNFQLFNAATSVGGTFAAVNLPSVVGYTWNTANLASLGTLSLAASAVPEPSAYAAFAGLAILGYAVRRRRR